jgi:hypothetical protein
MNAPFVCCRGCFGKGKKKATVWDAKSGKRPQAEEEAVVFLRPAASRRETRGEKKRGDVEFSARPMFLSPSLFVSLFPFLSLGALRSGCHDALAASPAAAAAAAVAAKTESERARELERAREKEERLKKSSMPAASGRKKNQNSRQRLGEDARPVPGHHVEQAPQQTVEGLKEV